MAIMDIAPVCDGHILIIPKGHFETVFDVPEDMLAHMYKVADIVGQKAMKVTGENGFTMSINYGDKQEVKHVHLHILPNYNIAPSKSIEDVYKALMED